MSVDRRELFKIVGAGFVSHNALAQHEHRTPTSRLGNYKPRAFSSQQYAILGRMLEILLPADDSSPSAREAGVGMYLDTVLKHGDEAMRQSWISGIGAIDRLAREATGSSFAKLDDSAATSLLSKIAEKEARPGTVAEKFFVDFKQSSINAYYLSEAGRRSLGYTGDTAVSDFTGCTHSEHKGD